MTAKDKVHPLKQTKTGQIPEGWKLLSIDELATFSSGHGFKPEEWSKSGFPIIRIQNLNGSRDFNYYALEPDPQWIVNPGELLFAWAGVKGVSFGPCIWSGSTGLLNQHIYRVRPKAEVDKNWLFWTLKQVTHKIEAHAHGFKYNLLHVRKADIVGQLVLVPPFQEQKKIVEILGSVEESIASTQAVIDQTRKVKQGLLQQLLTKGIGHTKFKESAIGKIPVTWEYVTLGELLNRGDLLGVQDGNHGERHPKASDYVSKGVPFIMARDLVNGSVDTTSCAFITQEKADSLRIGFSQPGDILLTHKGTIGNVAITPKGWAYIMLTPQITYYRVNPNGALINYFLYQVFRSPIFQNRITQLSAQSTRNYMGITDQKKLVVPLPPKNEQQEILNILETNDIAERLQSNELESLKHLKRGLMQDLLTGKVRVKQTSLT